MNLKKVFIYRNNRKIGLDFRNKKTKHNKKIIKKKNQLKYKLNEFKTKNNLQNLKYTFSLNYCFVVVAVVVVINVVVVIFFFCF